MTFHLPLFLVSVVLLWIPRPWLRRGPVFFQRHHRPVDPWNIREAGDPCISFKGEFTKLRNYIELFRAAVGSFVLLGGAGFPAAISVATGASRADVWRVLALQAGVLLVGVLIQTLRWEKRHIAFFPPIFYLAGLTLAWCDLRSGAFAFALIWAFNPALPNARGFLIMYAFLIVVFAQLFSGRGLIEVAFAGFLAFLPVLLSLLARRPLALLTRKASHGGVRA